MLRENIRRVRFALLFLRENIHVTAVAALYGVFFF